MSLFVVNRFTGEESENKVIATEDRLKKLKEEITRRKEQRLKKDHPLDNAEGFHLNQRSQRELKRPVKDEPSDAPAENISGRTGKDNKLSVEEKVEADDNKVADGPVDTPQLNEDSETLKHDNSNVIGGFSILGNFQNKDLTPVKRALPDWLANPSVIKGSLKRPKTEVEIVRGQESDMTLLDGDLRTKLEENGIYSFFPVQKTFIPVLLQDLKHGVFGGTCGLRPRDICVSAPTGSGKTLAFVLPITQCLKCRVVPHVRAVVVLPVRDLAEQVYSVFRQYCAGTPLKVGLAVGKKTFSVEQTLLVKKREGLYHSLVDILVATPGRLVDHISSTPGFDLTHLRFLVIDEADRMMEDIKLDWLTTLETAVFTPSPLAYFPLSRSTPGPLNIASAQSSQMPLQKLLFSATLSHNPEKLQQLNLFMPRLLTSVVMEEPSHSHASNTDQKETVEGVGDEEKRETANTSDKYLGKYTTPEGLAEYFVQCSVSEKPLLVLHFLHHLKFRQVLCFANSLEATHRLYLLIKLYGGIRVHEFSSRLQGEKRKRILRKFAKGQVDLLICSDAMARGMDIENVKFVILYDHPPYLTTYVHRVGRTARAGKAGTSISFLEKSEIIHFKQMMRNAGKWPKIQEMKINRSVLRPLVEPFKKSLGQLSTVLKVKKRKHGKVDLGTS